MGADLDLESIVAAVRSCPGVSAVSATARPAAESDGDPGSGSPPLVLSYDEFTFAVSVVAFSGLRLSAVVAQIEAALRPLIGARRLDVTVEDIDTATGTGTDPSEGARGPGEPPRP